MSTLLDVITTLARSRGYTEADIRAGIECAKRKSRLAHPPGTFDKAGRFYASEPFASPVRPPSRAYPNSHMLHARTAGHCAHVYGATPLHVKRIVKAIEGADALEGHDVSAHEAMQASREFALILKRVGSTA